MPGLRIVARLPGKFHLALALMAVVACGCAAGLSSSQKAMVKELHLSTHALPHHARRVSLSPMGILEIESVESQGDYDKGIGNRTLIDVRSGRRIWSGSLQEGHLLTDTPSPILVETGEKKHAIIRYANDGGTMWRIDQDSLFVFGLSKKAQGVLLTLSLTASDDGSVQAILNEFSLADGVRLWRNNLGMMTMEDPEIGSLWRYQERPIFGHGDKVFLLLENRAICISALDGHVLVDRKIPIDSTLTGRGNFIWVPADKDVVVVNGPHVLHLSESADQHGYTNLGKNYTATEARRIGDHIVIAFTGSGQRGVAAVNLSTTSMRWLSSEKSNDASPPKGIASIENSLVVASNGRLHGFDHDTGKSLFTQKIRSDVSTLLAHDGAVVLLGRNCIERRNAKDGSLLWEKDKLDSPLAWAYRQRGTSMAIIGASMQASANIAANQSRWYYNRAGKTFGGSYAYDPWTRSQYTQLGNTAGRSAAAAQFGASLAGAAGASSSFIDKAISVVVDMEPNDQSQKNAYFTVPVKTSGLTGQTYIGKVLVVSMADGSTSDIPIKQSPMTCVPTAMVSERLGIVVQAYHKFPFCKASRTVDIYKLPSAQ